MDTNTNDGKTLNTCPDCGVRPGKVHLRNCDVERCSVCGGQRFGCDCKRHNTKLTRWTGEWPGVAECRSHGWYCVLVPGQGWQPCDADTPQATEDLSRLRFFEVYGFDEYEKGNDH